MLYWKEFVVNGCIIAGVIVTSVLVYYYSKDDCPLGTMPCSTKGKCVPQQNVCNGYYDCPEGEDEEAVLCADLHGSTLLIDSVLNISFKEKLQIQQSYNTCDVENYPSTCVCRYRTRIYCNNAQLTEIPQNISETVTYLGLLNNSIHILTNNSLDRYDLKLLFLEGNDLSYLAPNSFHNQRKMKKLFLMDNNLTILERGAFNGLTSLKWLFLDNNNLKTIEMTNFAEIYFAEWINLSNNSLDFSRNEEFPYLPNLLELFLNDNKIKLITEHLFANLHGLHLLNVRKNLIEYIHGDAFKNLKELRELDLYENRLKYLPGHVFLSQIELAKLYLGKNPFTFLQKELFTNLQNLKSLNLEAIELKNLDVTMFEKLVNLESIYFKTYKYCAFSSRVRRCRPLSDGISSTNQLLFKPVLRGSIWIMCFITIGGNSLVLFSRYLFKDENKTLSIVLKHLAVSDGLMGIYLLLIAYHDIKYRDNYNSNAILWMSSCTCILTGIIGMVSLEVSVMLLVFMSVDRFFIITMPFGKYASLSSKETWRVLLSIWCFGIAISVIPVMGFMSSTKFYGVSGLCLPLYIDDPYLLGWEYSALIFFGINAPSLAIIIFVYIGMFINIKNTRSATSLATNDYEFAVRFFFIVLANIACWMPIIVAKIIVYCGVEISGDVYGWLIIFILPINSSLNPILYTFTTSKYRKRLIQLPSCIKKIVNPNVPESRISGSISTIKKHLHRKRCENS